MGINDLAYSGVIARFAELYTDFPQSRPEVFRRQSFIFKTKSSGNSLHCKIQLYICINRANKLLFLFKDYYVNV